MRPLLIQHIQHIQPFQPFQPMRCVLAISFGVLSVASLTSCSPKIAVPTASPPLLATIAFGSCAQEDQPLPIFDVIVAHAPDLFIFLGDNIYGDTYDMDTLRVKYARLAAKPGFRRLKASTEIIATWDDHDFGWNDAGKEYPYKEEAKSIFLDFFDEPMDSERRSRPGVYQSYDYTYGDRKLQIILLDGRTFRDTLKPYGGEFDDDRRYSFYDLDYAPHTSPGPTFLGEAQWAWLEEEFREPADLRLICSGTQFGAEFNGYEAWANFPHERQRMLDLIAETRAAGVMFLSGDIHYSEISKLETPSYPIYDFTSSGLSSTWLFATPNANRIEGPVMDNHFGLLTIDWAKDDPSVEMETWDVSGNQRMAYGVSLSELQFD